MARNDDKENAPSGSGPDENIGSDGKNAEQPIPGITREEAVEIIKEELSVFGNGVAEMVDEKIGEIKIPTQSSASGSVKIGDKETAKLVAEIAADILVRIAERTTPDRKKAYDLSETNINLAVSTAKTIVEKTIEA